MSHVNANRYVFTLIKSGISDFKRFSGSFVFYLLKDVGGTLYLKRSDWIVDEEVPVIEDSSHLNRYAISNSFTLNDESSGTVHVGAIGFDPTKFYSPEYDRAYYSYLESGIWKTIGYESPLSGINPSYAILVRVSSDKIFFVFQDGNNVSIYEVGVSSIVKKSEIENFYLIDAKAYGLDIMLFVSKNNIEYPSEIVEEPFLSDAYEYFVGSPSVFVCESSADYSTYSYFCANRSVFPTICKRDRELNAFCIRDDVVYALSLGFSASLNGFVPIVALGRNTDSWRRPAVVYPFGYLLGVDQVYFAVGPRALMYASCKKGNNIYLTYYSRSENVWKPYDSGIALSFEDSQMYGSSSFSSDSMSSQSTSSESFSSQSRSSQSFISDSRSSESLSSDSLSSQSRSSESLSSQSMSSQSMSSQSRSSESLCSQSRSSESFSSQSRSSESFSSQSMSSQSRSSNSGSWSSQSMSSQSRSSESFSSQSRTSESFSSESMTSQSRSSESFCSQSMSSQSRSSQSEQSESFSSQSMSSQSGSSESFYSESSQSMSSQSMGSESLSSESRASESFSSQSMSSQSRSSESMSSQSMSSQSRSSNSGSWSSQSMSSQSRGSESFSSESMSSQSRSSESFSSQSMSSDSISSQSFSSQSAVSTSMSSESFSSQSLSSQSLSSQSLSSLSSSFEPGIYCVGFTLFSGPGCVGSIISTANDCVTIGSIDAWNYWNSCREEWNYLGSVGSGPWEDFGACMAACISSSSSTSGSSSDSTSNSMSSSNSTSTSASGSSSNSTSTSASGSSSNSTSTSASGSSSNSTSTSASGSSSNSTSTSASSNSSESLASDTYNGPGAYCLQIDWWAGPGCSTGYEGHYVLGCVNIVDQADFDSYQVGVCVEMIPPECRIQSLKGPYSSPGLCAISCVPT